MLKLKMLTLWDAALYAAATGVLYISIRGVTATGSWVPVLLLVPLLAILLPPLRRKLDPRSRYLPSAPWALGTALVLVIFQGTLFASHAADSEAKKQAKLQQESKDRIAKVHSDRSAEYERDKLQILERVEALLVSNQPKEALATANTYFAVNKDPDLARLQSRAELGMMKLELQNEAALSLTRREQIYTTLIKNEPGNFVRYQAKLNELAIAAASERKLQTQAAERSALEANIKTQFSAWDGSHRGVETALKAELKNPKSYEHVETRYSVGANTITVFTTYRGTNGFGAVVTNRAVATVDKNGNVLTLSAI